LFTFPERRRRRRRSRYVKTPARLAASLAILEKARAAPKGLVYRPTVKRLLAYRASLLKALEAKRAGPALSQSPQDDQDI